MMLSKIFLFLGIKIEFSKRRFVAKVQKGIGGNENKLEGIRPIANSEHHGSNRKKSFRPRHIAAYK